MAIKKTITKSTETKKRVTKSTAAAKKTARPAAKTKVTTMAAPEVKENIVEKKLSSVMDSNYSEGTAPVAATSATVKRQKNSAWWGILALLLLVVFAGILLYQYNNDFKTNLNKLARSTGLIKLDKDDAGAAKVVSKDMFSMKLTIVYDKADANQKTTIDKYLGNIEKNLQNTKVDATWYDRNDVQGQALITKTDAKFLPIFLTDESVKKHPQYALFAPAIKNVNGVLMFQSEGMEYLKIPEVGDAKFRGADPKKAKVVIIEYASLTCGFCKMMQPILDKVATDHKDNVSVVTKHFDRGGIDSVLAQAAECAGEQGKFDKMMDTFYDKQTDMFSAIQAAKDPQKGTDDQIKVIAKAAGANGDKVLACVKTGKYADMVKKDTEEGIAYGVIGTPSMFINKTFLGGALAQDAFNKMVEAELKK